eukprot:TRINITY_DN4524_c0_g2_i1.p1 TRINITY_DN4524_c0_g2~~TRINITY_DN4524_c0_g2_i1.p1  ORF type:complete len:214 (+),score=31.72 TRINITY_DN4524_c0_g2_i1:189-830(+)
MMDDAFAMNNQPPPPNEGLYGPSVLPFFNSGDVLGGPARCIIGETLGAAACAAIFGWVAALIFGDQSLPQFMAQVVGAGSGSYSMAGPVGCPLVPGSMLNFGSTDSTREFRPKSSGQQQPRERDTPVGVAKPVMWVRFAGAGAAGLLAWLVFTPDLDFQLVASSIMVSAGALGFSILMEDDPSKIDSSLESKGAPTSVEMGSSEDGGHRAVDA